MRITRNRFLRITGIAALAVAGRKLARLFGGPDGAAAASPPVRWAMVIDTQKCLKKAGCIDCIAACHKVHNVPEIKDRAHEIKWVWKEPFKQAFPAQETAYTEEAYKGKPFPVLCNHCDNPPCVRVCPTKATWKREDGLVMMDWHRCIGCRYCMAACPYGSRSFNWVDPRPHLRRIDIEFPMRTKGVVEKCTFCAERLARGQAPACVQACKEQKALVFGNLADPDSDVSRLVRSRFTLRRKPGLGTNPEVYYIIG